MKSDDISACERLLGEFQSLTLAEMESVSLQERQDTKFSFHLSKLPALLGRVQNHYSVLEIEQRRVFTYQSIYYDTPELDTYLMHHNKRPMRYKLRLRKYVESGTNFFELKRKTVKGKTVKTRISVQDDFDIHSLSSEETLAKLLPLPLSELSARVQINYRRFTLTDKQFNERVTVDMDLACQIPGEDSSLTSFPDLVIAEVKQSRFNRSSPLVGALQEQRILPHSLSKYCLGVLTCFPGIKYNRFKLGLHRLEKITGQAIHTGISNGNF